MPSERDAEKAMVLQCRHKTDEYRRTRSAVPKGSGAKAAHRHQNRRKGLRLVATRRHNRGLTEDIGRTINHSLSSGSRLSFGQPIRLICELRRSPIKLTHVLAIAPEPAEGIDDVWEKIGTSPVRDGRE